MKHKEFLAGIIIGATIFGATPVIASGIIAELSIQPIYVDGTQVSMTAYAINGNNYVKLRDIGKAVDFNVSWNDTEGCVEIDSQAAYEADDKSTEVAQTAPKTVAEMVTQTCLTHDEIKTAYRITLENETYPDKLSTGLSITDENITAMLDELSALYPHGLSWGANYNDGDIYWYDNTFGCDSYVALVRDVLYGLE